MQEHIPIQAGLLTETDIHTQEIPTIITAGLIPGITTTPVITPTIEITTVIPNVFTPAPVAHKEIMAGLTAIVPLRVIVLVAADMEEAILAVDLVVGAIPIVDLVEEAILVADLAEVILPEALVVALTSAVAAVEEDKLHLYKLIPIPTFK